MAKFTGYRPGESGELEPAWSRKAGIETPDGDLTWKNVGPAVQFVAVHDRVMQGARRVALACSKTMAKRIANALNKHTPNREGV